MRGSSWADSVSIWREIGWCFCVEMDYHLDRAAWRHWLGRPVFHKRFPTGGGWRGPEIQRHLQQPSTPNARRDTYPWHQSTPCTSASSADSRQSCTSLHRTIRASGTNKTFISIRASRNKTRFEQTHLLHFPLVTLVRSGYIVCQRLRAGEVMVAARRSNNITLAGNLASEAGYRAGDLVDLAEEKNTGEAAGKQVSL